MSFATGHNLVTGSMHYTLEHGDLGYRGKESQYSASHGAIDKKLSHFFYSCSFDQLFMHQSKDMKAMSTYIIPLPRFIQCLLDLQIKAYNLITAYNIPFYLAQDI